MFWDRTSWKSTVSLIKNTACKWIWIQFTVNKFKTLSHFETEGSHEVLKMPKKRGDLLTIMTTISQLPTCLWRLSIVITLFSEHLNFPRKVGEFAFAKLSQLRQEEEPSFSHATTGTRSILWLDHTLQISWTCHSQHDPKPWIPRAKVT